MRVNYTEMGSKRIFSIWWNLVAFNAYFDQFTITENSHIQNSNGIVKADHTFYLKFELAHNDHHQLKYVQNRLYHVKYEYGKCQEYVHA